MLTCRTCKTSYADFRQSCPTCGQPKPVGSLPARSRDRAEYVCDHCQRACRTPERCDTCDGYFHKGCMNAHAKPCRDHATELDFQDWVNDYK